MHNKIARIGFVVCSFLVAFAIGPVQAEFPDKPVTIVVPWQAGSSPDVAMRTLAALASDDLGQPIVVQNIVGGSGSVGTLAVKNAEADGYTLLHNWVAPHVVARLFNPDIGYNDDDFAPLFGLIALPFTLAVRSDHPATDVLSFVEWANAQDRPVNVGICAALSVPAHGDGRSSCASPASRATSPCPSTAACRTMSRRCWTARSTLRRAC